MSVSELVQRLVGRRRERQAEIKATFESVVAALADGESVDEHEIDTMLEICGKSPEALQAAVERLQQRRDGQAQLAEVATLRKQVVDAEKLLADLNAEKSTFIEQIDRRIRAAYQTVSDTRATADAKENAARRILEQTAPGSIPSRMADILERRKPLVKRERALLESLRIGSMPLSLAAAVQIEQQKVKGIESRGLSGTSEHAKHVASLETLERRLADAKRELAEVQAQLAALEAEQAAVQAEVYSA